MTSQARRVEGLRRGTSEAGIGPTGEGRDFLLILEQDIPCGFVRFVHGVEGSLCLLRFEEAGKLHQRIRLMAEIDEVIATHGGWPGAFHAAPA